MRADLAEALTGAEVPAIPGMLVADGRVLSVDDDRVTVWDGRGVREVGEDVVPDLEDPATYMLCIAVLCDRTGLDPGTGALWYRSEDGDDAWVLEGPDEVRTRDGDTDDPLLALARALAETA